MSVTIFGIDAASVRNHCFPHSEAFSATTAPTATTVAEKINEQAGYLAGVLMNSGVAAANIAASSAAYYQCANILRLMVAIEMSQSMTGVNAEAVKAWQARVDAWKKQLDEQGVAALGDTSLASDADVRGPRTHISEFSLDTPDADMSDVVFPFRVSDDL